jgi:hypothetical protein
VERHPPTVLLGKFLGVVHCSCSSLSSRVTFATPFSAATGRESFSRIRRELIPSLARGEQSPSEAQFRWYCTRESGVHDRATCTHGKRPGKREARASSSTASGAGWLPPCSGGERRRATLPRRMRSEDGSSDAKNKELDEQKVVLALSAPWWRERSRPAGRPEPMCRVTRPRQVHVKGARASTIFERRSQQSAHPPRAVLAGL